MRARARLLACRWIGKISTLARKKIIRRPRASLWCRGRYHMVIEPAVLIIGNEDDGISPVGSAPDSVDNAGNKRLAKLNVVRRMLIIRRTSINPGDLWQFGDPGRARCDRQKVLK